MHTEARAEGAGPGGMIATHLEAVDVVVDIPREGEVFVERTAAHGLLARSMDPQAEFHQALILLHLLLNLHRT